MCVYTCTTCGCSWDKDGFYTYKGEIYQPCRECRKDATSTNYYENQFVILEARRDRYYKQHDAKKAYFRAKRRKYRAQQRRASPVPA